MPNNQPLPSGLESGHDRKMWKHLPKLNGAVQSLSGWLAVFGAMSAAFIWLSKHLTVFGPLGWPEAVFLGIGAACLVVLVLSFGLVAWRRFHPLDAGRRGSPATSGQLAHISTPELRQQLEAKIATVEARLRTAIAELSMQLDANVSTSTTVARLDIDLSLLLSWAVRRLSGERIFRMIDIAPNFDGAHPPTDKSARHEQIEIANRWRRDVLSKSVDTMWHHDVDFIIRHVEVEAERDVRAMNQAEMNNLAQLDYRDYYVVMKQCNALRNLLVAKRDELAYDDTNHLTLLRERLNLRRDNG